jgi:hypothetical protein
LQSCLMENASRQQAREECAHDATMMEVWDQGKPVDGG